MLKVALTGGIGCGKSSVCKLFSQYNVPIIDTDIIARELVEPGTAVLMQITSHFGLQILHKNGYLNRKKLAQIIFSDQQSRYQLESILHPKIRLRVNEKIQKLNSAYSIIAIPLLIETSQAEYYDRVLVVDCKQQQQIERTQQRDIRSLNEINAIISAQVSREKRLKLADDIIDNSLQKSELELQVSKLHDKYRLLAQISSRKK